MNHSLILPVLWPLLTAVLFVWFPKRKHHLIWPISFVSALGLLCFNGYLLLQSASTTEIITYAMGNWAAPFGIVFVLDKLSALLLFLNALLFVASILYTYPQNAKKHAQLQSYLHFLVMGIHGAFLTGDLFNLFVFFEVLLIASYTLVVFGGGKERTQASLHYVIINLVGSSLFIIALGIIYGLLGTMNLADLAVKSQAISEQARPLLSVGVLLLLFVFGLKAAIIPLFFWLPKAYSHTQPAVAALFAILTKVGLYAIIRVILQTFGHPALWSEITVWIWPIALTTLLAGSIGVLGSKRLRYQISYAVITSVGIILAGIAIHSEASIQALLYYLISSTLIASCLYLLADHILTHRQTAEDLLIPGPVLPHHTWVAVIFFVAAVALAGMPPLTGFYGKLALMQATPIGWLQVWFWGALIASSGMLIVGFTRSGSLLFWKAYSYEASSTKKESPTLEASATVSATQIAQGTAILLLWSLILALAIGAEPVLRFLQATSAQLLDTSAYHKAILHTNSMHLGGAQ